MKLKGIRKWCVLCMMCLAGMVLGAGSAFASGSGGQADDSQGAYGFEQYAEHDGLLYTGVPGNQPGVCVYNPGDQTLQEFASCRDVYQGSADWMGLTFTEKYLYILAMSGSYEVISQYALDGTYVGKVAEIAGGQAGYFYFYGNYIYYLDSNGDLNRLEIGTGAEPETVDDTAMWRLFTMDADGNCLGYVVYGDGAEFYSGVRLLSSGGSIQDGAQEFLQEQNGAAFTDIGTGDRLYLLSAGEGSGYVLHAGDFSITELTCPAFALAGVGDKAAYCTNDSKMLGIYDPGTQESTALVDAGEGLVLPVEVSGATKVYYKYEGEDSPKMCSVTLDGQIEVLGDYII